MIRNTHKLGGENVLSAYSDNAAVVAGSMGGRFYPDPASKEYGYSQEPVHLLMKVETHNHPTAIAPFSGAGTGSGGEIRDEGAVGRGSKPKVGLVGFTVSNLQIPNYIQPWEEDYGKPDRIVSALILWLRAPLVVRRLITNLADPTYAVTLEPLKLILPVSVAVITSP
jgi:phosphoribosylformylglycinamidine synthase